METMAIFATVLGVVYAGLTYINGKFYGRKESNSAPRDPAKRKLGPVANHRASG